MRKGSEVDSGDGTVVRLLSLRGAERAMGGYAEGADGADGAADVRKLEVAVRFAAAETPGERGRFGASPRAPASTRTTVGGRRDSPASL